MTKERASYLVPVLVVVLCAIYLMKTAWIPGHADGTADLDAFGRLPVVYQGRVKPFDTLARTSLVIVSDRQTFTGEGGVRLPAIRWLLDVLSGTQEASKHKVFRIQNLRLLEFLGLEARPGFRYAYEEFKQAMVALDGEISRVHHLEAGQRDVFDNQMLEFSRKVSLYNYFLAAHSTHLDLSQPQQLRQEIARQESIDSFPLPHVIPPISADQEWQSFMRARLVAAMRRTGDDPAAQKFQDILMAWRSKDSNAFNGAVAAYGRLIDQRQPEGVSKLGFEVFFNHFEPFYRCAVLYVIAFLLCCFSWLKWTKTLNRTAFWLMVMTLMVHSFAIVSRIYISGYPPVTNLYSSAIFIGWGFTALGLIIEVVYRMGIGNLVASVVGFLTLLVAHFLAGDGDTMEMMQAVLDTKFWLATHVTTITLGYSATFFAGAVAIYFILAGLLTKSVTKEAETALCRIIYGVVCFALLLSFVGTVLGGLWADDSWGRFWGWDPKENGALMIVLWNAIILHTRWAGLIRNRGLAVMAVFGNIVTVWSWFGVNQLGVGLHSYGFTDSAAFWILVFVSTQLVIMGLGLIPLKRWSSFRKSIKPQSVTTSAAFGTGD